MTRLLLAHPGASISVSDVYDGYEAALRAADAQVVPYRLDYRLEHSAACMALRWKQAGKPKDRQPTWDDTLYHASVEILERALREQPDWVVSFSGMYLHPDALVLMQRAGIRVAVLLTESPYDQEQEAELLPFVDLAWTNERSSVSYFLHRGGNVRYLRHAYDPAKHRPLADLSTEPEVPAHDVVFVGTGFQERIDALAAVDWTGIDLGLYGCWDLLGSRHRLRKYVRDGLVNNATTTALYRRASIGLNLYRTSKGYGKKAPRIAHAESMNPRAYEAAASGLFTISDYRAEQQETLGASVPTFRQADELGPLIRGYLGAPDERQRLARLARQCVEPHTFAARAAQLMADLDSQSQRSQLAKGA